MPRCSGAWGAALGEAREWCPLLPCLEDPLPASSRKPSRVARACPTTCSHQLHNCWALESSRLGRGRGSRNVCSHSNREGGMMPPDLNLAQPIGHGLVTQARPLPAAAAWEQGEAQGRGAGGPARFQLCQPGLGPSGLCPVSVCPPHCPQWTHERGQGKRYKCGRLPRADACLEPGEDKSARGAQLSLWAGKRVRLLIKPGMSEESRAGVACLERERERGPGSMTQRISGLVWIACSPKQQRV